MISKLGLQAKKSGHAIQCSYSEIAFLESRFEQSRWLANFLGQFYLTFKKKSKTTSKNKLFIKNCYSIKSTIFGLQRIKALDKLKLVKLTYVGKVLSPSRISLLP